MRPAWFLLLALWASDVTLPAHALSIVPNGLRHSITKRDASPPKQSVKIYDLHVESRIEYRFATTRISSRIANAANVSQEVFFNVVIPETAFISGFKMEVDNKVYEAYVKEKDAAKREYSQAVARGQTAAHVAASARDSNRFTVSVNVEPHKKVTYNLTYDELLTRRMGAYNLVVNLDPGKVVHSMSVDVYIKENRNITVLRVPELRTGNEVDADETTTGNSLATIVRTSATEAHVSFAPTIEQQKSLHMGAHPSRGNSKKTLKGQFVVQYDVDRDSEAGDVLVNDGYFVHFFAPKNLTPLRKHAIFVLDVSGSMSGQKLNQLKEAMLTILANLNEGDHFSIVEFSDNVMVWDLDALPENVNLGRRSSTCGLGSKVSCDADSLVLGSAFPATATYIDKAKESVKRMTTIGGTNMHDALKVALKVAHNSAGLPAEEMRSPLIVFLTDGQPSFSTTEQILATVKERNSNPAVAIFSLAFGNDAEFDFLKKLSLRNLGFARKIYLASDAALQLRDFYRQIASPLLANVTFSYQLDKIVQEATTKTHFPTLFLGSEIVVAGKLQNEVPTGTDSNSLEINVLGLSHSGDMRRRLFVPHEYREAPINHTVTPLEKLWAYLTIKQLLEAQETETSDVTVDNSNTTNVFKQRSLELALKYSFVTPLTSLVVVKPQDSGIIGEAVPEVIEVDEELEVDSMVHSGRSYIRAPRPPMRMSPRRRPTFYFDVPSTYSGYSLPNAHQISVGSSQRVASPRLVVNHEDYEFDKDDDTPAPEAPALIPMEELEWLETVRHGSDVLLPFGPSGLNQTYSLLLVPGTYLQHLTCAGNQGVVRYCQHLKDCPLNVIKRDIQSYSAYFCTIQTYAGVCCPVDLAKPLTTSTTGPGVDTTAR